MKTSKTTLVLLLLLIGTLSACSFTKQSEHTPTQQRWLQDGMIVINRSIPSQSDLSSVPTALAFLPVQGAKIGTWVVIDRSNSSMALMDGDNVVESSKGQGFENLTPGSYELVHKQRSALWYAPDSYFTARKLPVPSQSDRNRYRRGALGEYVLFIGENTPIHSGPVWMSEIGGAKLAEEELAKMYYRLSVGTPVEVK